MVADRVDISEKRTCRQHNRVDAIHHSLDQLHITRVELFGNIRRLNRNTEQISLVDIDEMIHVLQKRQHVAAQIRDQRAHIKLCFDGTAQLVAAALYIRRLIEKSIELITRSLIEVDAHSAAENHARFGYLVEKFVDLILEGSRAAE